MNELGASLLENRSAIPDPLVGQTLSPVLSPLQSQADSLVGGFVSQATDWRSLAAMTAGGMAYRMGRIGIMGLGAGTGVRALSVGVGLTAEVSTFELAHRSLHAENTNLWRWSGAGGIRQGLFHSFVTFGALKGMGRLAAGENLVARHLLQDTAMVAAHQATGLLGIGPAPSGSLAEQFLHAEATNLQMGAGMALAGSVAPGIHALERGLDLTLRITNVGAGFPRPQLGPRTGEETSPLQNGLHPALAVEGGRGRGTSPSVRHPSKAGSLVMAMAGNNAAISSWPPPPEEPVSETAIPGRKISGVMAKQDGEPFPYVALEEYRTQTLSLIRMGLTSLDVAQILEREGKGGLSLEAAAEAPRMRGLLLAEASNQGLVQGIFPRNLRQWNLVQRLIESAYVHFDLDTLRSYRENLSLEWWRQYENYLAERAQKADVPLQRLDRPLPGEYILPRTDHLRDHFLKQVFVRDRGLGEKDVRSPMDNVSLLRDPLGLGVLFKETFNNVLFTPLVVVKDYLQKNAPEGGVVVLLDPRYELNGLMASMRERLWERLREIPEFVRILTGGQGPFHRDFLQSVFKEEEIRPGRGIYQDSSYEEIRKFIDDIPEDLRRELGTEPLPPLSELLSSNP